MIRFFLFLVIFFASKVFSQVNHQTGSATFGLPLFNWQDNKSKLNLGILLNYNSGNGLKVNDLASCVGQGWNLMAGGVITRIQAGEPDDQKPYMTFGADVYNDTKKYPAGYLYNDLEIKKGVSASVNQYPVFKTKNVLYKQYNEVNADKELDRFAFQFNGRTGIFVLNKNTNKGKSLEDSRIRIWFVRNENMANFQIRTTIVEFYIQDENGHIYKFTKYGTTKILKTSYCNADQTGVLTQPTFKDNRVYHEMAREDAEIINPNIINEWHLVEIEDALTHRKINFNYVMRNINAPAGTSITHYNEHNVKDYSVVSHFSSKTQTPELSSITYPDGHQVMLNYGKLRADLNGGYALASIDIKYGGRFISKYEFITSYFILNRIGSPVSDYQKSVARLCLLSFKKIGVDLKEDEPSYFFKYNMGTSLPGDVIPAPFSHLKDIWGFYNADYSRDYFNMPITLTNDLSVLANTQLMGLCFLRNNQNELALNAKPCYAKNGLLKEINYPTGGSIKYDYEQNTAVIEGYSGNTNVGGVHVSKTSVTDGGFSNNCNNPIVTNYNYSDASNSNQSSLWGIEMPVNSLTSSSFYEPYEKYFYYKPVFNFGCKYRYQNPGIVNKEQAVDLTAGQKRLQILSVVLDVVSAVSQVLDVITVCVSATPAAWVAIILDVISSIVNIALTCFSDASKDSNTTIYYNSDINGGNSLPSQFKRVEIIEGLGQNGKTVIEFTSADDYSVWEPTNPSFSMKQRFAPWAYGLQKKVSVYNNSNQIVKETENIYKYDYAKMNTITYGPGHSSWQTYPSCKYLVTKNSSQKSDNWLSEANYKYPDTYINYSTSSLIVEMYNVFTGRVLLHSTKEKVFTTGTPFFLTTTSEFTYDNFFLPTEIYLINSDGSRKRSYTTYNSYLENLLFLPVENTIMWAPNNTTPFLPIGATTTEYTYTTNGDLKPLKNFEKRFTAPGFPINPPYIETQSFIYDANSNLKGQKDEGNRKITNIYDYADKYAVATVVNADPLNDICAYSSFETNFLGGFTYSGPSINYVANTGATGLRTLSLPNKATLAIAISSNKKYKLSFFSKAGVPNVVNAILEKSWHNPVTRFTYYEYLTSANATSIQVKGKLSAPSAIIDELRLYPENSTMRSVTYDPIIGKTNECDENSRVTSYEYDNLGRLRFIKNESNQVIKMYEYNIAKKPPCPITYTNFTANEIYTKNDCPSGYVGSQVTYSIAAGTYTSTFSQEAVDVMVEKDLNTNGQNYANANGGCIPVYFNTMLSATFVKEGCPLGYKGAVINYHVIAGKYKSIISQAHANEQAQDEIDANGQAFANTQDNINCIIDYEAQWEGTGCTDCNNNQHTVQVIDVNPNSNTYNQTQWINTGDACPVNPSPAARFVRLERSNEFYYYDPYYEIQSADHTLKFYQDQACTISLILPFNMDVAYQHYYYYENSFGYIDGLNYNNYPAAAGTSEYVIGNILLYHYQWWGNDFQREVNNIQLMPDCKYAIGY